MNTKNEKLLITVEVAKSNIDETTKEIVRLKSEIAKTKSEQKKATKEYKDGAISQKEYKNVILKTTKELSNNSGQLRKENQTLKLNQKYVNSVTGSYDRLSAELTMLRRKQKSGNAMTTQQTQRIKKLDKQLKHADKSMGNFQRNVGNYRNALKGFGAVIGGIIMGVTAVVMALSRAKRVADEFIEAYDDQFLAEKKLAVIMKERANATDQQIQSVIKLTQVQQENGVVGDEVQLAGAQQLQTFLHSTDAVKTLIPAMNNLIAQQKGVNGTQQDAITIANMMGKVMDGQVSALTRVGISLTDHQKELLKTGTEQEKVAMLAEVIKGNVGDMNKELSLTDAGKIQQVENELGDVKEEIGKELIPVMAYFYKLALKFIKNIERMAKGLGLFKDETDDLTTAQIRQKKSNDKLNKTIVTEKTKINELLLVAKNENISKNKRLTAINNLNKINPDYIKGITLENIETGKTITMIDNYISALERKTKAEIASQNLSDIQGQIFQAKIELTKIQLKYSQDNKEYEAGIKMQLANGKDILQIQKDYAQSGDFAGQKAAQEYMNMTTAVNIYKKSIFDLNEEQKLYLKTLDGMNFDFGDAFDNGGTGGTGDAPEPEPKPKPEIIDDKLDYLSQKGTDLKALQYDEDLINYHEHLENKLQYLKKYNEENTRLTEKDYKRQEVMMNNISNIAMQAGEMLGQLATDSEATAKDYAKAMLIMTLEAVKNTILIYEGEILAKELASKSFLGIASASLLIGLTQATFAGIESKVKGFANGGIISGGVPIQRANGDDTLITAKKGEAILNEKQQSIIGINNLRLAGVQGFAEGGIISSGMRSAISQQPKTNTVLVVRDLENIQNQQINEIKYSKI